MKVKQSISSQFVAASNMKKERYHFQLRVEVWFLWPLL
jgi:hypothetical protein